MSDSHRFLAATDPESIPAARDHVRDLVTELMSGEQLESLIIAVSEAVTNAVRHADAQTYWVDVVADDRTVTVSVSDDGKGAETTHTQMPSPTAQGGRGFPLMAVLVDDVTVDTTPEGTTVRLVVDAGGSSDPSGRSDASSTA